MEVNLFAITGTVASGKSTVAKMLRNKNIPVINIDDMMYDIFKAGTITHKELLDLLGPQILNVDGTIDIALLSVMMCKEKWISDIIENIVEEELEDVLYGITNTLESIGISIACIEGSKILSSNLKQFFQKIIFITAEKDIRTNRIMIRSSIQRNIAEKIIEAETDFDIKSQADFVVYNNGNKEELFEQVNKVYDEIIFSMSLDDK